MVRARRGGALLMVGLVVATHGGLAEELLRTAEGIVGRLEQCEAVSIGASLFHGRLPRAARRRP